MRTLLILFLVAAPLDASILEHLQLGKTTPKQLRKIFSKVIPQPHDSFRCHKDDIQAICDFKKGKLNTYTIFFPYDSDKLTALGGKDGFIAATTEAIGKPTIKDKLTYWVVGNNHLIINEIKTGIEITRKRKAKKRRLELKNVYVIKPPKEESHYFTGWQRKWTKWIELERGTYTIESRHKERGNFIVYMVGETDRQLVINEIGPNAYALEHIKIYENAKQVAFLIHDASGSWEFTIRKVR